MDEDLYILNHDRMTALDYFNLAALPFRVAGAIIAALIDYALIRLDGLK